MRTLSKTLYLQSLQCPRILWLAANAPSRLPRPSAAQEHRMAEGREVEGHARLLFPGGILIGHGGGIDKVATETDAVLRRAEFGKAIFRPLLRHGDLVCECDVLLPLEDGDFDLYEVKATTAVKPEHLPDAAFQLHVASLAGVPIRRCHIVTLNGRYVRRGEIDPDSLFRVNDVTEGIRPHIEAVPENAAEAVRVVALPECPAVAIGTQCAGCPLRETDDGCWGHVNGEPHNVFSLYRIPAKRAFGWYGQGFLRSADVPEDYPLSDRQRIQVEAERTGRPHVDKAEIGHFLRRLKAPLFLLDFETFSTAVPLLNGCRPYQQVPFQFSLHILRNGLGGTPQHISWIWDADTQEDPREEMLHCLQHLLDYSGSVIAYNAIFEKMVLRQAADVHPEYRDWVEAICRRFVDLLLPFRAFHAYHPAQHGSCSLKSVLPAWTGKGYSGLAISDGGQAGREYVRAMFGDAGEDERQRVRKALEAYCGLDTGGMVAILRAQQSATAWQPRRCP